MPVDVVENVLILLPAKRWTRVKKLFVNTEGGGYGLMILNVVYYDY